MRTTVKQSFVLNTIIIEDYRYFATCPRIPCLGGWVGGEYLHTSINAIQVRATVQGVVFNLLLWDYISRYVFCTLCLG